MNYKNLKKHANIMLVSVLVLPVPPRTVKLGSVLLHVTILIVIVSIKSINVASSVNDQDQDQSSGCQMSM